MTTWLKSLITFCLLTSPFFVAPAMAISNPYDGNWYVGVGAGRSLYSMDSDNYINPGYGWQSDHYYKNDIHDGSFVQGNLGYAWTRYDTWFPSFQLGIRYDYAFNGKVSGYINQYDLVEFKNYTYSYDFSRQTVLGVIKVTIFNGKGFMPFVLAGAGSSFNRASSYKEEPTPNVTPRISPGYGTDANWHRSYIFGLGFDYAISEDIWMALEYNYGNFGKVETGNGVVTPSIPSIDYSGQHLTNKLKANSFLLSFTYLLNYV